MPSNFDKVFGKGNTVNTGSSSFVKPGSFDQESRKFDGSTTPKKKKKDGPPYGPPNAPTVASTRGGMTISDVGSMGGPRGASTGAGVSAGAGGGSTGAVMASTDKRTSYMESREEKFYAFVESLRTQENAHLLDTVVTGFNALNEATKEKWAKEAGEKLKKGSLKKALGVSDDKDIVDSDLSAETIANKAEKAFGHKKAMSKLNFAANVDKTSNVLDAARNKLAKKNKKK